MLLVIFAFVIISTLLVWYLLRHDHGRRLPVGPLWGAFGFGILALVIAFILEVIVIPNKVSTAPLSTSISTRLFSALGVGVIEETCKFLPLALFLFRKPYFREHTDGVIYFAICGLTFGLFENIEYTLSMGAGAGIYRLFLTPFFHAAATSTLGFYLASYKVDRQTRPKLILACILIPLIHGMYDFGLLSANLVLLTVSLMLTVLLTMALFLYFTHANDLDRATLAAVPVPVVQNFCPRCGRQNVRHTRFCEYCGQQL
ncbi:MAG TPA: PrsW family glutamic-type intramembrane protease [Verrucomicrobiae bacterium]|nr:PrsW family glutamic-type intramembrane protease [Verrucomicrobiae bacterium]